MTNNTTGYAIIAASLIGLYYLVSKDVKALSNAFPKLSDPFNFNYIFDDLAKTRKERFDWLKSLLPEIPGTTDPVTAVQPGQPGSISIPGLPDLVTQPGDFIDPNLIRSGRWQPQLPEPIRVLWDDSGISAPQSYVDSVSGGGSSPTVTPIITDQWGQSNSSGGSGGGTYPAGSYRGQGGIVD